VAVSDTFSRQVGLFRELASLSGGQRRLFSRLPFVSRISIADPSQPHESTHDVHHMGNPRTQGETGGSNDAILSGNGRLRPQSSPRQPPTAAKATESRTATDSYTSKWEEHLWSSDASQQQKTRTAYCIAICNRDAIGCCAVWAVPYGLCRMGCAVWAVPYGLCRMGCAVWAVPYGLCRMGCAVWAAPYGLRRMGCAVWALYMRLYKLTNAAVTAAVGVLTRHLTIDYQSC
jgi:hypothetical protein